MPPKPISENQTQFAQAEPIFEEVVTHEDETVLEEQRKKKKKRKLIITGIIGLCITFIILIRLLPPPKQPEVTEPTPTPVPTAAPIDTSLLGRIQRARQNTEDIDFYQSDLSFPQVDEELFLDPPKAQ